MYQPRSMPLPRLPHDRSQVLRHGTTATVPPLPPIPARAAGTVRIQAAPPAGEGLWRTLDSISATGAALRHAASRLVHVDARH